MPIRLPFATASILFFALTSPCLSSQQGINNPPGRQEVEKHPLVLEAPTGPQPRRLNVAEVRHDAMELATLAQSLPSEIEQVTNGTLPKDLNQKLKRIEKLSKSLRSQIALQ